MQHFISQGGGHLVGISSISAVRGYGYCPSYNASKAFVSNFAEGMRHLAAKKKVPVYVTDVKPGFVDTPMIKDFDLDKKFWVASAEKAAQQIYNAVRKKKYHVYITRRWRLIAWIMRYVPEFLYLRG
jgi:short-subunit dehydrogenase